MAQDDRPGVKPGFGPYLSVFLLLNAPTFQWLRRKAINDRVSLQDVVNRLLADILSTYPSDGETLRKDLSDLMKKFKDVDLGNKVMLDVRCDLFDRVKRATPPPYFPRNVVGALLMRYTDTQSA